MQSTKCYLLPPEACPLWPAHIYVSPTNIWQQTWFSAAFLVCTRNWQSVTQMAFWFVHAWAPYGNPILNSKFR